jgi:hypothetical protein
MLWRRHADPLDWAYLVLVVSEALLIAWIVASCVFGR